MWPRVYTLDAQRERRATRGDTRIYTLLYRNFTCMVYNPSWQYRTINKHMCTYIMYTFTSCEVVCGKRFLSVSRVSSMIFLSFSSSFHLSLSLCRFFFSFIFFYSFSIFFCFFVRLCHHFPVYLSLRIVFRSRCILHKLTGARVVMKVHRITSKRADIYNRHENACSSHFFLFVLLYDMISFHI